MPRSRKSQRAKGRANREEILNLKRNDGVGVKDPTPFVAVLNLIMRGKYLRVARGFPIKSTIKEINKIEEVPVNRLREVRKEKGLSQLKLAFMTNIAPCEISRVENGWLRPYPSWRKRFANALGVTEADLFPEEQGDASKGDATKKSPSLTHQQIEDYTRGAAQLHDFLRNPLLIPNTPNPVLQKLISAMACRKRN